MKKIMKAFAAIAALAMVSSGFAACSDDEEEDTSPSISIKADSALTVAAGEDFSVDATLTLKNDSFAGDIPQGVSLNTFIEDWIVTDENDFAAPPDVVAAETAAEGSKVLKITISGTAADVTSTKNGTIKIKLVADAVKSGKSLTTNAIKYQFTAAGVDSVTAIALPYTADFTALTDGTAVTADTYVAGHTETGTPSVDLSGFPTDAVPLEVNGASAKNGLRLRSGTNNINYNGGTKEVFATTTVGDTLSETLDRYVGLDVSKLDATGNVTVTFTGIAKTSDKGTAYLGQVVLIDQNKTILASATNLKIDGTGTAEGESSFTLTATIDPSSVTKVILGFSRGGVGGGGIDLTGITAVAAQ